VERADEIFVDSAMSRKWSPNPTGTLTNKLLVVWKRAMKTPNEGSVKISAIAVLTHADFTMKSGVKLFKWWLAYASLVRLLFNCFNI
jgi:hypothetical protein